MAEEPSHAGTFGSGSGQSNGASSEGDLTAPVGGIPERGRTNSKIGRGDTREVDWVVLDVGINVLRSDRVSLSSAPFRLSKL